MPRRRSRWMSLPADVAVKGSCSYLRPECRGEANPPGEKVASRLPRRVGASDRAMPSGRDRDLWSLGVDSRRLVRPSGESPRRRRRRGPGRLYSEGDAGGSPRPSNSIASPTATGLYACQPARPSGRCRNGAISTKVPAHRLGSRDRLSKCGWSFFRAKCGRCVLRRCAITRRIFPCSRRRLYFETFIRESRVQESRGASRMAFGTRLPAGNSAGLLEVFVVLA